MIRIAVCDDDDAEIRMIKRHSEEYAVKHGMEIVVDSYHDGEELTKIYSIGKYDIIFLDVEMNNLDGLATAEHIRRLPDHNVVIMFVSNYPEYMQASFNVRAAQYMTKPLLYETYESKINQILEYFREEKDRIIEFTINMKDSLFVNEQELISIRSMSKIGKSREIEVESTKSRFVAKGTLKFYLEEYGDFLVCPNRSILINSRYVHKFEGKELILKSGERVEISRNHISEIKDEIRKKIMQRINCNGRSNW